MLISRGKPWACVALVLLWTALACASGLQQSQAPGITGIVVSAAFMCVLFLGCSVLTAYGARGEHGTWHILRHDLCIRHDWKRAVAVGVVSGILMTIVSCALSSLLTYALRKIGITPKQQEVVEIFAHASRGVKAVLATSVLLMNPVVEEIFFRYALCSTLVGVTRSAKWGAIGTAICFALVHTNAVAFLPLVFVSFFCTYALRKTGNIVAPITAHMIHNAATLVSLLFIGQ